MLLVNMQAFYAAPTRSGCCDGFSLLHVIFSAEVVSILTAAFSLLSKLSKRLGRGIRQEKNAAVTIDDDSCSEFIGECGV